MHRLISAIAIATALAAFAAAPAMAGDYEECDRYNVEELPPYGKNWQALSNRKIAACSRVIRAGKLPAKRLSEMYKRRAGRWQLQNQHAKAIADWTDALRLDPGCCHGQRAQDYMQLSDFDRAIADYSEAIRLKPGAGYMDRFERGHSYVLRGKAHRGKGDLDKALADFRQAEDAFPDAQPGLHDPRKEVAAEVTKIEQQIAARDAVRPAKVAEKSQPSQIVTPSPAPVAKQQSAVSSALPAQLERRVALVIGNSGYAHTARLPNPRGDAEALARTLKGIGFTSVELKLDLDRNRLLDTLKNFAAVAAQADWAIVYFAGHGLEIGGVNYLVPVDAKLASDRDITFEAVALEQVLQSVDGARKLRIAILDACRDNPFVKSMSRTLATRSLGRGLAAVEPQRATLVAYAARHGQVALDGSGANSPYVSALIKNLQTPGIEISLLFRKIRDDVLAATGNTQEPFTYGSLPSEAFYFSKR